MPQNTDYIIVQAGGLGSRLGKLTKNKPKGLVPVDNLPILFHLFRKYPQSHFVIIGDYLFDVLEAYLGCFANVTYDLVRAHEKGTCSGIKDALSFVPDDSPFTIIWSDLVLDQGYKAPEDDGNYIGLSTFFPCRWSFRDGSMVEAPSVEEGIAGVFYLSNKSAIEDVPASGEFVRYLSNKAISFTPVPLQGCKEIGTTLAYEKENKECVCRPFNRTYVQDGLFVKEAIDEQGKALAEKENAWYEHLKGWDLPYIPKVYGFDPLRMELIDGVNPFKLQLASEEKQNVLRHAVEVLNHLHSLEEKPCSKNDIKKCYFDKTFGRIERLIDLIPFAKERLIRINDVDCPSPFELKESILQIIETEFGDRPFCLIHGDPTFSNMMLRKDGSIVLIDPRGYFGGSALYGDPLYDFAKLYYSFKGNYDSFNNKRFELSMHHDGVHLSIESNGYESLEDEFFALIGDENRKAIKFLHALLWPSLTSYAWEDYDSILGAFYNGTYLLWEALSEYGAI